MFPQTIWDLDDDYEPETDEEKKEALFDFLGTDKTPRRKRLIRFAEEFRTVVKTHQKVTSNDRLQFWETV